MLQLLPFGLSAKCKNRTPAILKVGHPPFFPAEVDTDLSQITIMIKEEDSSGDSSRSSSKMISKEGIEIEASDQLMNEITDVFKIFEIDRSGKMPIEKVKKAMHLLGFEPKKEEVQQYLKAFHNEERALLATLQTGRNFDHLDRSRSDQITCQQLIEIILNRLTKQNYDYDILKAFRLFDFDKKGHINVRNLKIIATKLGEKLDDDELQHMFNEADLNCDGLVNEEEFMLFMSAAKKF
uniref:EF-hand domain-containing protein n=1 Tax=Romanomermis culicivorax TaxID=13658 RepID=A0A915KM14_ROMCU